MRQLARAWDPRVVETQGLEQFPGSDTTVSVAVLLQHGGVARQRLRENPLRRWLFDRSSNFRLKNSRSQQRQYREGAGELIPQLHSVSSLWSPAGAPHWLNPAGRWEIPLTVPTAQGRGRRGENECEEGNSTIFFFFYHATKLLLTFWTGLGIIKTDNF